MSLKIKKLGDAELDIMLVLWDVTEKVTSSYILDRIKDQHTWALSTLMTTLARLVEKGFIYCDRSTRTNYYIALVTEKDYKAKESCSFLEKLYGNSIQNFVTTLYDSKAINKDDLTALRKLIDNIEKEHNND